jgi:hypothetical protein
MKIQEMNAIESMVRQLTDETFNTSVLEQTEECMRANTSLFSLKISSPPATSDAPVSGVAE